MKRESTKEGQRGNATRPFHQGQMLDAKVGLERQGNKKMRLQSHEQDMEISCEDKPLPLTFEGLERKFRGEIMKLMKEQCDAEDLENARHREKINNIKTRYGQKLSSLQDKQANHSQDEIVKLMKEQCDAEDAENARHREKINEINTLYREKLPSHRTKQANRREELLHKELQTQQHQYQQAEMDHHLTNTAQWDPYDYGGAAVAEAQAHKAYSDDLCNNTGPCACYQTFE
ncbi:uncharacterized protein LOC132311183 [Cornus florida]|uniref:uncharacterized protein LOC132311183 n=1 Tax=Cornus florida TaxID=4283 RepID=UPI002896CB03|nr:uncharacterized protein LOC132311183 [Cornus florida]